jgi:anti-sigma regulatory factor (Ser/Thr protein kinase)
MRHPATQHQPAVPAGPTAAWEQAYPGTADQARHVRAALGPLLAGFPAAADVILLVSELVANAVIHSNSGAAGGSFTVRLTRIPGVHVTAEVTDQGSTWDADLRASAVHRHGLYLLQELSDACGVRGSGQTRTVWFRIGCPGPPS